MPITFSEADRRLILSNRRKLKSFIKQVLCKSEGWTIGNLSYVFCSDEYLIEINRRFLHHDFYTDIITFDMGVGTGNVVEGEIYISLDRVLENSSHLGFPFSEEILRVIFHGVLHLCGYRDKTKKDTLAMRTAEDKYLQLFHSYVP